MADFPDLEEADVGPTRGSRSIDRTFTNFSGSVRAAGTVPPLETEDSRRSDHKIAFVEAALERAQAFKWITYSYRYYNQQSADLFGDWVVANDWESVIWAPDSNSKAAAYQGEVNDAIERFFPLQTTK